MGWSLQTQMDPLPGGSGAKHYPILLQKGEKSYRDFKSSQKFSAKIGKRRNTHMTYKTFTRKKALPAKEPRQCLFPDVSMFCKGYASFKRDSLKTYIPPTSGYSHSANSDIVGCIWGDFTGKTFANMLIFHLLFGALHFLSIKIVSQKTRDYKSSGLCKYLSKLASNWGQFRPLTSTQNQRRRASTFGACPPW